MMTPTLPLAFRRRTEDAPESLQMFVSRNVTVLEVNSNAKGPFTPDEQRYTGALQPYS